MPKQILRIDASARKSGSITRELNDTIVERFLADGNTTVSVRDLADEALPQLTENWIGANFTKPEERSQDQKEALALSDSLIAEINSADVLLIGLPIYNFGVPAALKAWVDLVARRPN